MPEMDAAAINTSLELLRQGFDKLKKMAEAGRLSGPIPGSDPRFDIAVDLLVAISVHGERVRDYFSHHTMADTPIVSLPQHLVNFYEQEYLPRSVLLEELYGGILWDAIDLRGLLASPNPQPEERSNDTETPVLDTIHCAVERHQDAVDWNSDWPESITACDEAMAIVRGVWFAPDAWLENMRALQPIVSARAASQFPVHVRIRLKEIYRSFVFGNWLALFAMSRSLLEYALIDRATTFGVETYCLTNGETMLRRLADLIDKYAERLPDLRDAMDALREFGNIAMHPKRSYDVVRFPHLLKRDALLAVQHIRAVILVLYEKKS